MNYLAELTSSEKQALLDAPLLVTILIAGADDNIDKREKSWASKISNYRSNTAHHTLKDYYELAAVDFDSRLDTLIEELPNSGAERLPILTSKLALLNTVLQKLDARFAKAFYESMKTFAKEIAEASGGILGWFSKSKEEEKYLNLDMINDPYPDM
jgi:hypothetical protein